MTPAQADTHRHRQQAAENLEHAHQNLREADRYGLANGRLIDAAAEAEQAYNQAVAA